jgi:hypothetical protein
VAAREAAVRGDGHDVGGAVRPVTIFTVEGKGEDLEYIGIVL